MRKKKFTLLLIIFIFLISCGKSGKADNIQESRNTGTAVEIKSIVIPDGMTVDKRYNLPEGYTRMTFPEDSFAHYLQTFPVKKYGENVYYFDGREKPNKVHDSILDIDVGTQDLQQCADAIMRLRAEYLYKNKRYKEISFNFVNGFDANFDKWASGYKISNSSNKSTWVKSGKEDYGYENFRKYLIMVFSYANTYSLDKQMKSKDIKDMIPGDVFIKPGFPGHAIIVMDVGQNKEGNKVFLLAQSYMPAQDMHILKNFNSKISPWYSLDEIKQTLNTPEWTFTSDQFKTF